MKWPWQKKQQGKTGYVTLRLIPEANNEWLGYKIHLDVATYSGEVDVSWESPTGNEKLTAYPGGDACFEMDIRTLSWKDRL